MPDTLVMKSTQRGLVSHYAFCAMFAALFILVSIWGLYYISSTYAKYGVDSFEAFEQTMRGRGGVPGDIHFLTVAAHATKWAGGALALISILAGIRAAIYDARRITIVGKSPEGKPAITVSTTEFFWTERVLNVPFDGLTGVEVSQGFWDKLLDAGTIALLTISYVHDKAQQGWYKIPAIANPREAEAWILANIPRYGYGTQASVKLSVDQ